MQRDYNDYFFLIRVLKSKKKETGTNIVLLSWKGNMIGWFIKTYLHKPIKIVQFLSRGEIQKCLT